MVKTRRRRRSPMLQTALRGGAAGLVAGVAVTIVEREVGDRGRIATGAASQVAYAGVLGAAYAVLREETRESRAGRILLATFSRVTAMTLGALSR
jgi:hypothetical protein